MGVANILHMKWIIHFMCDDFECVRNKFNYCPSDSPKNKLCLHYVMRIFSPIREWKWSKMLHFPEHSIRSQFFRIPSKWITTFKTHDWWPNNGKFLKKILKKSNNYFLVNFNSIWSEIWLKFEKFPHLNEWSRFGIDRNRSGSDN